mmetsp:Transcript_20282/g.40584  ORF Transcript_20282/g.40584 Transcript_20282/m.40584 type:complete len:318 (+) Transcript_20282:365-1318(+)
MQTGSSDMLLTLNGTVAMFFKGSQYNIPVDIYLPLDYPSRPPLVYVRPTATMALKEGHRHVDREGLVYMPYLHEWSKHSHNLVTMCQHLSQIFGQDPPVFARPASQPFHPPQPPSYQSVAGSSSNPPSNPPPPSYSTLERDTSFKASGSTDLEKLTVKIQNELQEFYNDARSDISADLKLQAALSQSQEEIAQTHMNLRRLKVDLAAAIEDTNSKTAELKAVAEQKTSELADKEKLDPDTLIVGIDPNSAKMAELCARIAAIDDTMYYCDRALTNGTVSLDEMLKESRKLARKQFLAKAHVKKIVEGVSGLSNYCVR